MLRRVQILHCPLPGLNAIAEYRGERFGCTPSTCGMAINLRVLAYVVDALRVAMLPPDTVPTLAWYDPMTEELCVQLHSEMFEVVPEGCAPAAQPRLHVLEYTEGSETYLRFNLESAPDTPTVLSRPSDKDPS